MGVRDIVLTSSNPPARPSSLTCRSRKRKGWARTRVSLGWGGLGQRCHLARRRYENVSTPRKKEASRPQNPGDFADHLRRIANVVKDIETDDEARTGILKWQSLP